MCWCTSAAVGESGAGSGAGKEASFYSTVRIRSVNLVSTARNPTEIVCLISSGRFEAGIAIVVALRLENLNGMMGRLAHSDIVELIRREIIFRAIAKFRRCLKERGKKTEHYDSHVHNGARLKKQVLIDYGILMLRDHRLKVNYGTIRGGVNVLSVYAYIFTP